MAAIMIEVADVVGLCADLKAKTCAHARPGVEERPWGQIDMAIQDPAGNRLIFFTPADVHDDARTRAMRDFG